MQPRNTADASVAPSANASASASASAAVPGLSSDEPALTEVEQRIQELKRRAADIQAAHRPTDRATRVILKSAPPSAAGHDSAAGAADSGDYDEDDPEIQKMLIEYTKKRTAEFGADKVRACVASPFHVLACRGDNSRVPSPCRK